jgi:hypothetical protein
MKRVQLQTSEGPVEIEVAGYKSPGRPVGLKIVGGNMMLQLMPTLIIDRNDAITLATTILVECGRAVIVEEKLNG